MTAGAHATWKLEMRPTNVPAWLAVGALILALASGAQAQSSYETPPILQATDLAPAGLLAGQGYTVAGEVPTTGLLGQFTLKADVGTFTPNGLELLRIRVGELAAIRQLDDTSKTAEFAKAAGRAAVRPVQATVNMVANPIDTISGMPASVGRFFDRVKLGGQAIAGAASDPDKGGMEKTAAVSGRIGTATINALGYEEERRHLAKKVNVDPYTTNPILAEKLDNIAWVAFSAKQAVSLTTAALMPYSMVMSTVSLTNNLVWDMKPADLINLNQQKAKDMGASEDQAQALIANKYYSISALTAFMAALERLGPIAGRPEVIALAATAASEDQARFLMGAAQMLAHHHEWVTPLTTVLARGTVVGKTAAGGLVVGAPVDYVAWTESVANFARRPDFAASSLDIWLTGRMSPRARQEFERIGWRVHEGSQSAAGN
jgi:hypothetical protein